MPYGDEWNETTPVESEGLAQGDDRIRELKRAIGERLRSVLNWDNDPVTLILPADTIDKTMLAAALKASIVEYVKKVTIAINITLAADAEQDIVATATGLTTTYPDYMFIVQMRNNTDWAKVGKQVRVTAANQITVTLRNNSAGSITLTGDIQVYVLAPMG